MYTLSILHVTDYREALDEQLKEKTALAKDLHVYT